MKSGSRLLLVASLLPMFACESGQGPRSSQSSSPPSARSVAHPAVPPPVAPPPAAAPVAVAAPAVEPPKPAGSAVEWRGNIQWRTWDEARAIARRESKPMLVLVYADWCPHCRALAPVFADPEIEALAKRFVMVRQNHDDDPAWLEPYNQKYGGYVPRIFFFDSSGKLREDLTSGHPRYPFFYAAEQPEFLKVTMRRAVGG